MKKVVFLKVLVGSRGFIEEVVKVESSYEEIVEENEEYFRGLWEGEEEGEDREGMIEYVEEFCSVEVNKDKGIILVGLNEEECEYYIEYDRYKGDCDKLIKLYEEDDSVEFNDLMMKFWDCFF
jgi:hypothetical protein